MFHTSNVVLLILCITSFTSGVSCCMNGTGNCYFEMDPCSWTLGGNVTIASIHNVRHIVFHSGENAGNLTSRAVCSTGGQTHCLRFAYKFDENDVFGLSVSIKLDLAYEAESLLWKMSSSASWITVGIPFTTNLTFSLIFRAETLCGQNASQGRVRVYQIRYQNSSESCELQARNATPTSCSTTISSHGTHSVVQHTHSTSATTLSTTSSNGENKDVQPSVKLGIIVGVVVGVIVLIFVVILLFVLLRRKRRHSSKPNNTPENSDQHRPDTTTHSQPSDNCNIMRSPGNTHPSAESEIPEYAVVNKQRTKKQENPPQSPYENCDHDAQNLNQNSELDRAHEQGQGRDVISSTPTNPDPMIASGSRVYQVPRGDTTPKDTTPKSEDQGEEYNALDFEGQRSFSDNKITEETCEDGAGTVYSHLNNGEEDAYNEVWQG